MPYVPLGPRPANAVADTTGQNVGNWTVSLSSSVIQASVPYFELYHLFIKSPTLAAAQTSAQVMINNNFWDATLVAQLNSWDPSQPALLTPGDDVDILFNVPINMEPPPFVCGWFRYDPTIPANPRV